MKVSRLDSRLRRNDGTFDVFDMFHAIYCDTAMIVIFPFCTFAPLPRRSLQRSSGLTPQPPVRYPFLLSIFVQTNYGNALVRVYVTAIFSGLFKPTRQLLTTNVFAGETSSEPFAGNFDA